MLPIVEIACKVLNHLIQQEAWAHRLLILHEGKVLLLQLPAGEVMLQIKGGYFSSYKSSTDKSATKLQDYQTLIQPSVTFTVSQDAVWGYLSGGKTAALKHVKIAVDAFFASDVMEAFFSSNSRGKIVL